MKTAVILQPHYLPYCGFFKLIEKSDVFVFFDNVQFEARSWQHRNRIKTPLDFKWLTVPVIKTFGQKISDVQINNELQWQKQHLTAIQQSYGRAPCFSDYKDFFNEVYSKKFTSLSDLNIYLIKWLCSTMGFKTEFIKASELDVSAKRSELLANICKKVNATHYYSNIGSKEYMDKEMEFFKGIDVSYLDYKHPEYSQQFSGFVSHLSVIDLLFNHGPKSREIILGDTNATSN